MRQIGLTIAGFLLIVLVTGLAILSRELPHYEQLKSSFASHDRAVLDRNGNFLDEIHPGGAGHRFNWVEFNELPPHLQKAFASDDLNLAERITGGGSYWRTKLIEWTWRKSELAEVYLNHAIFRRELEGLSAASFGVFDKRPADLDRSEAALLLALAEHEDVNSITIAACDWLNRMDAPEECGLLSQDHLIQLEMSYRIQPFFKLAPQFTVQFASAVELARGGVVRTTLDRDLQWSIIQRLFKSGLNHAAVAVIENSSGHLLAYVNTELDVHDLASHEAESVLLPFLYGQGLDERVITAGTRLEKVPAREALVNRLELQGLATLKLVGAAHFARTLHALGLTGFAKSESFGPSLALGGVEARVLEVANAYRALANAGVWTPFKISPDKLSEKGAIKIFTPETAFIVGDILHESGGFSRLESRSWSVGFSDSYTVGVWSSQDGGAGALWRDVMGQLLKQEPTLKPPPPDGLVRAAAADSKGHLHGEWFLGGTEPGAQDGTSVASRISYPQDHSTIELDKKENLLIKVVAPRSNQNLYLNGERLGRAKSYISWEPRSGKFTLELRDSQGHSLDRVRFEVRGRSFALRASGL